MEKFAKSFEDKQQKGDLPNRKHDQRHETGRLKLARRPTERNVTNVDELVGPLGDA